MNSFCLVCVFFFFKQKTAYELRSSDWSSDVCSSDLSRYEAANDTHHDHLIDVESGKVIEFVDPDLEELQRKIAEKLGFRLVGHRMELYGVALSRER